MFTTSAAAAAEPEAQHGAELIRPQHGHRRREDLCGLFVVQIFVVCSWSRSSWSVRGSDPRGLFVVQILVDPLGSETRKKKKKEKKEKKREEEGQEEEEEEEEEDKKKDKKKRKRRRRPLLWNAGALQQHNDWVRGRLAGWRQGHDTSWTSRPLNQPQPI
ncbi:uncharacterized protein V6R79_020395 [Siganus canaliculatus]